MKKLSTTVADRVYQEIEELKTTQTRSEFVEELLRIGLDKIKKERGVQQ